MIVEGVSPQEMQAFGTALNYVAKRPLERIGQILDARMSYWHFTNLLATAEKVQAKLEAKGLRPEQLDPKLREIVPMLEAAKSEDDPTLQEMWVSLLTASLDPDISEAALPFTELLKSITPFEAKVLAVFGPSGAGFIPFLTPDDNYDVQVGKLANMLSVEAKTTKLALRHLEHQGLLLLPEPERRESVSTAMGPGFLVRNKFIDLSEIGLAFVQRCTYRADNA